MACGGFTTSIDRAAPAAPSGRSRRAARAIRRAGVRSGRGIPSARADYRGSAMGGPAGRRAGSLGLGASAPHERARSSRSRADRRRRSAAPIRSTRDLGRRRRGPLACSSRDQRPSAIPRPGRCADRGRLRSRKRSIRPVGEARDAARAPRVPPRAADGPSWRRSRAGARDLQVVLVDRSPRPASRGSALRRSDRARPRCAGAVLAARFARRPRTSGRGNLEARGRAWRIGAARVRHPIRGKPRDVRALLKLQGRPGSRSSPDEAARTSPAMSLSGWALSDDLGAAATVALGLIGVGAVVLLLAELRQRERGGAVVASTGLLGVLLFAAAVLRPVRIAVRGTRVGPRVVVLVDQSRRLLIPAAGGTRRSRALSAVRELSKHFKDARLSVLGFGQGATRSLSLDATGAPSGLTVDSDLRAAMGSLADGALERPRAVVVVSDGRLSSPGADEVTAASVGALG